MEKYGTYRVFKHEITGEIKRIPVTDSVEASLKKLGNKDLWKELFEDEG